MQAKISVLNGNVFHGSASRYWYDADRYGFASPAYTVYKPSDWLNIDFDADPRYQKVWRDGTLHRSDLSLADYAAKFFGKYHYFLLWPLMAALLLAVA